MEIKFFLTKICQLITILAFLNTINILCTENDQENESVNETVTKADTIEEKEYKLHRVILLRSWLLHFIGNIHDYFMTRVLQSTQIDLHASLMQCQDLDGILDVHNRYISKIYDRCFLHPSASVIKGTILV